MEKFIINNELGRTDTNSIYSEFVRVCTSSLLLFISLLFVIVIYEPGFMAHFAFSVVNYFEMRRLA
ncbi:MAG: hypothetical protein O8C55_07670 [Candidatus Methanoperedens sp.]|nr:hypothetical protein [Candidatus Methanoperedens sp.]